MGRPTKLTPEVQRRITDALRAGNTRRAAAEYGGVTFQTFLNWMETGKNAKSGQFFDFFDLVTRAEVECEVENVAVLKKAATGWPTSTTRTKTHTVEELVLDGGGKPVAGPDGKPLCKIITDTVTTTTVGRDFDWRASVEWLKRRRRSDWGEEAELARALQLVDLEKCTPEQIKRLSQGEHPLVVFFGKDESDSES